MTQPLGRLERVELRDCWSNEARDFTPWLAQEENIALLGETIGIELEVQKSEAAVGPFSADILCRNLADGSLVLIENQLEKTDHLHLGQLLTYAAGLDTKTIVWIAKRFTEQHRAALDWLNDTTHEGFNYFGLRVEAWRIGSSASAPKFDIVVQPNNWTKAVREVTGAQLTPAQQLWMGYWQAFGEFVEEQGRPITPPKPQKSHWTMWGLGRGGFAVNAAIFTRDHHVDVALEIYSKDAKTFFHLLHAQRESIEAEIAFALDWQEKPELKRSMVVCSREANPGDPTTWKELHVWMLERIQAFDRVFRSRIRDLDPN